MKKRNETTMVILIGIAALFLIAAVTVVTMYFAGSIGKNEYQKQIEIAQQYIAVQNYDGAISAYYTAIDIDEKQETAYLGLADVYETRGELNYLSYILETGYRNTNSAEIQNRLDHLNEVLLANKVGQTGQLMYLNVSLVQQFAISTYADYRDYYESNDNTQRDHATVVTGETLSDGSYKKIYYADAGITFYYPNGTITDGTRPAEIHLDDLRALFSGMTDQISYEELGNMGLERLQKTTQGSIGTMISFQIYDCTVWIACDSNGTIVARDAWNCIVPADVESENQEENTSNAHDLSGYIRSATTGQNIENVTLTVYGQTGNKIAEYETGYDGRYLFENLEDGYYTVELDADGYIAETVDVYVDRWNLEIEQDFLLSPILSVGQIRIVLSWGQMPSDLDSHLFGSGVHVYYMDPVATRNGTKIAELDIDDIDGYGPETTTIYDTSGSYHFMVEDFGGTEGLGTSGAQVKIYLDDGSSPIVINVNPAAKNAWDVCRITNGQVEIINELADSVG